MSSVSTQNVLYKGYDSFRVGSQITYPCYKSFDEFIDLEFLHLLDDHLAAYINRYIHKQKENFVNLSRPRKSVPDQPGIGDIWLTRIKPEMLCKNPNKTNCSELWEFTETAADLPLLMDFVKTLPFQQIGRALIFYTDAGKEISAHRDHGDSEICDEFIWFRTNLTRAFYVFNNETNEKKYINSYSAWFDTVNQYYGSDASQGLVFSFRVEGIFTEEFRKLIPIAC